MYYIQKYADCWAVYNDTTGKSRPLTEEEKDQVRQEFPQLANPQVQTLYTDHITSLLQLP